MYRIIDTVKKNCVCKKVGAGSTDSRISSVVVHQLFKICSFQRQIKLRIQLHPITDITLNLQIYFLQQEHLSSQVLISTGKKERKKYNCFAILSLLSSVFCMYTTRASLDYHSSEYNTDVGSRNQSQSQHIYYVWCGIIGRNKTEGGK